VYVTDTHALVHHLSGKPARLGKDARRIFQYAEEDKTLIYIPTVVLWELTRRLLAGELAFSVPFDQWCRGVELSGSFAFALLEWQDIEEARRFPYRDPLDCLIAGTAARLDVPLITKDSEIRDSGLVETIW
jgi:PIN domain nuclease of toxin-antitoxin system